MDETVGPWIFGSVHFRYKNSHTCGSCGKILIFLTFWETHFKRIHKKIEIHYAWYTYTLESKQKALSGDQMMWIKI